MELGKRRRDHGSMVHACTLLEIWILCADWSHRIGGLLRGQLKARDIPDAAHGSIRYGYAVVPVQWRRILGSIDGYFFHCLAHPHRSMTYSSFHNIHPAIHSSLLDHKHIRLITAKKEDARQKTKETMVCPVPSNMHPAT